MRTTLCIGLLLTIGLLYCTAQVTMYIKESKEWHKARNLRICEEFCVGVGSELLHQANRSCVCRSGHVVPR